MEAFGREPDKWSDESIEPPPRCLTQYWVLLLSSVLAYSLSLSLSSVYLWFTDSVCRLSGHHCSVDLCVLYDSSDCCYKPTIDAGPWSTSFAIHIDVKIKSKNSKNSTCMFNIFFSNCGIHIHNNVIANKVMRYIYCNRNSNVSWKNSLICFMFQTNKFWVECHVNS